jgi:hypothetical protein
VGHDVSLWQGIILESLSQAMKSAGFAIPGGLASRKVDCCCLHRLCGLPAEDAMALSHLKRLREMVPCVPALIASHPIAARAGMRSASDRETPVNTELS